MIRLLTSVLVLALASVAQAEQVRCTTTYGGESQSLVAQPVASPYGVKSTAIGSYFRFRVVFQNAPADLAAINIYTYADRDAGPVLIHQARYPYPAAQKADSAYGFTGLHWVYEPVRDGELQYWCRLEESGR